VTAVAKPDTLVVDGHGFSWQRLYRRRRIRLDSLDPIRLSGRRGRGAGAGVSLATNNFFRFLRERRRYWIVPITIMVAVFVIFFLVAQGAKLLPVILAWF
jgi:Family of unknown function (DUF5989)